MPQRLVTISYPHELTDLTRRLKHDLQDNDIRAWIFPDDAAPGRNHLEAYRDILQQADALIVMVSQDAVESEWVRRETFAAYCMGKTIIPLMAERIPIASLDQYVETKILADLYMMPLLEDYSATLHKLLAAVPQPPDEITQGDGRRKASSSFSGMDMVRLVAALVVLVAVVAVLTYINPSPLVVTMVIVVTVMALIYAGLLEIEAGLGWLAKLMGRGQ